MWRSRHCGVMLVSSGETKAAGPSEKPGLGPANKNRHLEIIIYQAHIVRCYLERNDISKMEHGDGAAY